MQIIDFHIHPFLDAADYLSFFSEAFPNPNPDMLLSDMNDAGVTYFCGSVISQTTDDYQKIITDNDKAYKLREALGARYIPGIHVHPGFVKDSIAEIERAAAHGIRLIGELVPYHHGWCDYSCDGFSEILYAVEKYGMTVSLHTMEHGQMQAMALKHPHVSFVFAHPGDPANMEKHIEVMKKCPNVYLDLSGGGLHRFGMLKTLCRAVGAERIIFGTDYPICCPKMYVNAVLGEHISDREKELILGLNATKLLQIN